MSERVNHLYELLPAVHRMRDAGQGYPLRALLEVIAEQVDVVEDDIAQLYENWFVETCQDWVVPYLGELIGYRPVTTIGEATRIASARRNAQTRLLIPRREVARSIGFRRRKGTLRLLEELAFAVAGWPARAVEFYRLLGVTQHLDFQHPNRGYTVELRDGDALENLGRPFDELAHTLDVRRADSKHARGRSSVADVSLFVWRLGAYAVSFAPAYCYEEAASNCYLFSALANDTRLFTRPVPAGGTAPGELNLPAPIRRRSFAEQDVHGSERPASGVPFYYGVDQSLAIWLGTPPELVPAERIVPADLSDWFYRPLPGQVAVDPELGRIMLPPGQKKQNVRVSYHYGFSADMGGGEYARPLSEPTGSTFYRVGEGEAFSRLNDALAKWRSDAPQHAVIEISDNGVYVEPVNVALASGQSLQLRAAERKRPILRLLNWETSLPDDLTVSGESQSWFVLDGIVVTGRGVRVEGQLSGLTIRHATLVPGWGLGLDCTPTRSGEASLDLAGAPECLSIEHSILGRIEVNHDEVSEDPLRIRVSDSIVDGLAEDAVAIGAPGRLCAHARLTLERSTVIGQVQAHSIELAENAILLGLVRVCRRQSGCVRFCYVSPGSRTPRRYHCQPDSVSARVADLFAQGKLDDSERIALLKSESARVVPVFVSRRYGTPGYMQLDLAGAVEIGRGAEDESELGAYHDLYQPQRAANLNARLQEYTPTGMNVGIIYAS